jgi:RNA polymerase sigma factor (sigma-70 family)
MRPFQVFLDEHAHDVHRFLVSIVGLSHADDCFQETFLSALRAYPKLRDGTNLRGWVFTIAHRKAMDHHRAAARTVPVASVPDAAIANGEPELWHLVRTLPPRQRDAVLYRYGADLPYTDVAEIMGCSVEAARRSALEGRKSLRKAIES